MDIVSYSVAAKQKQRIEQVIANPDSTSGIVTTPSVIAAGETITIPTGRTAVLPNTTVDGTLVVDGEVFIPSGSSYTATSINVSGNILVTGSGGLGYGTGSGGTVTQLTSKNTAVTLNKPCGRMITASDALVAGGVVMLIMNNSTYGSGDSVIVSTQSDSYSIEAKTGNVGVVYFLLKNISGSSLSDAISINFTIIKGTTA